VTKLRGISPIQLNLRGGENGGHSQEWITYLGGWLRKMGPDGPREGKSKNLHCRIKDVKGNGKVLTTLEGGSDVRLTLGGGEMGSIGAKKNFKGKHYRH